MLSFVTKQINKGRKIKANRKAHKGWTTSKRGPDLETWAERVEAVEGRVVISLGWNKFEGSVTVLLTFGS